MSQNAMTESPSAMIDAIDPFACKHDIAATSPVNLPSSSSSSSSPPKQLLTRSIMRVELPGHQPATRCRLPVHHLVPLDSKSISKGDLDGSTTSKSLDGFL
jgi:hypothetical protein